MYTCVDDCSQLRPYPAAALVKQAVANRLLCASCKTFGSTLHKDLGASHKRNCNSNSNSSNSSKVTLTNMCIAVCCIPFYSTAISQNVTGCSKQGGLLLVVFWSLKHVVMHKTKFLLLFNAIEYQYNINYM